MTVLVRVPQVLGGVERSEPRRSSLTAADGVPLALHEWPVLPGRSRRGAVVVAHGLGEHAGRHDRLAQFLARSGFAVFACDHRGHGRSGGARGRIPRDMQLVDDLALCVDHARGRIGAGERLVLLGHSMGGLVAAAHAMAHPEAIDALVLSSPALGADLNAVQRFLLRVLPTIAPNLAVGNGLDPQGLSHDPEVVRAYREDPLVHDRIAGRLARFITATGPQVVAAAPRWSVPTLLMWSGSDRLVDPRASRAFADAAPPSVVTARCFEALRHEIFNEQDAAPVYDLLRGWLDQLA